MSDPLDKDAISKALAGLAGWEHQDDKLRKRFKFGSFPEAISFMTRIGFAAEALEHHPELHNVYDTVDVALTTHDAGNKVTTKDLDLAKSIERISWV
jgi:4a-hydroxytetrahydrobiopterin dehydratase